MKIRNYVLAALLVVVLIAGAFMYLVKNLGGGGGLNIQLPEEIIVGETTNFLIVASVWGGGGSIKGRYTDITFGYRLQGTDEFTIVSSTPAELPENYKKAMMYPDSNNEYEAYSFTIPAFPVGTTGILEYYVDSTLDGHKNHTTGTRPVITKTVSLGVGSVVDLTQTYQNEEMGFEVKYPADWGIEVTADYKAKKANKVLFYNSPEATEATLTFEMLYGATSEGQSIEAWYRERFPGVVIGNEMKTVIDHDPALLVDTGSSYVLYTKVRLQDVLIVSFPKQPLYQKIVASLRFNVTNFGIVSFTQDDTATWQTVWRITLPNTETLSGRFQIKSVLSSRIYEQSNDGSKKEFSFDQSIPQEFLSSILVAPDQIQKQSGDPVIFSFMLNHKAVEANPEGPQSYSYIKPAFGFARHYAQDMTSGSEVTPFSLSGSIPLLGSGIASIDFTRAGNLVEGQLILATIITSDSFQYNIVLEELPF